MYIYVYIPSIKYLFAFYGNKKLISLCILKQSLVNPFKFSLTTPLPCNLYLQWRRAIAPLGLGVKPLPLCQRVIDVACTCNGNSGKRKKVFRSNPRNGNGMKRRGHKSRPATRSTQQLSARSPPCPPLLGSNFAIQIN